MSFWTFGYFLLAVATLATLYVIYSAGRTIGVLEYESTHRCVEIAR